MFLNFTRPLLDEYEDVSPVTTRDPHLVVEVGRRKHAPRALGSGEFEPTDPEPLEDDVHGRAVVISVERLETRYNPENARTTARISWATSSTSEERRSQPPGVRCSAIVSTSGG